MMKRLMVAVVAVLGGGCGQALCDRFNLRCEEVQPPNTDFTDLDEDAWSAEDGDCDDFNPAVFPTAPEVCDDADNNCDGLTDTTCTFRHRALKLPEAVSVGGSAEFSQQNYSGTDTAELLVHADGALWVLPTPITEQTRLQDGTSVLLSDRMPYGLWGS